MTRDELLGLVQKLDERGASEQEIATVVDSYRSELTIPVKKTSPVKHVDITDISHDPNVQHNGEETTETETPAATVGQVIGEATSDIVEVTDPEETDIIVQRPIKSETSPDSTEEKFTVSETMPDPYNVGLKEGVYVKKENKIYDIIGNEVHRIVDENTPLDLSLIHI